jgi:hypothetical protein
MSGISQEQNNIIQILAKVVIQQKNPTANFGLPCNGVVALPKIPGERTIGLKDDVIWLDKTTSFQAL